MGIGVLVGGTSVGDGVSVGQGVLVGVGGHSGPTGGAITVSGLRSNSTNVSVSIAKGFLVIVNSSLGLVGAVQHGMETKLILIPQAKWLQSMLQLPL